MKYLGRIIGETITSKFSVASVNYCYDDFVQVFSINGDYSSGSTICEIIDKRAFNKYFESSGMIKYIKENENLSNSTIYTYDAIPIAYIENGKVISKKMPFMPGSEVYYKVDQKIIELAYGISDGNIEIGETLSTPVCKIRIDVDLIFKPHISILGRTGSGKSFFVNGLIKSINDTEIFVFSPSDEYNEMGINNKFNILESNEIVLQYNTNSMRYLFNLNISEEKLLNKMILSKDRIYSTNEISDVIYNHFSNINNSDEYQIQLYSSDSDKNLRENVEIPNYANSLITKLNNFELNFALNDKDSTKLKNSCIVDMSESSQKEQECILNFFLSKLLMIKKNTKKSPLKRTIIVIEEAHNYVPSVKTTLCKETIIKIAREGRKLGISLCLITQRPRNFDQTILSQCSNLFVFNIPHPDDINHILNVSPYYNNKLLENIQQLNTGECMVLGNAFKKPITFKVKY